MTSPEPKPTPGIHLKADGFETEVIMKGLGEIDAIAEMFVKHLKKAESL